MITRGTTPYHSFIIPMVPEDIKKIYITYLQNGKVVFNKTEEDADITPIITKIDNANIDEVGENGEEGEIEVINTQVTLHLTQSDTLKLKFYPAAEKNIVVIQLRILDINDEAYASEVIRERVFGVLKDGVIKDRG